MAVTSGDATFTRRVDETEDAGEYCFPPIAACITAGARLLLATAERLVNDGGGVVAYCDTDSLAVVATEHGGLVPCAHGPERLPDGSESVKALSWAEVDALVARLDALHPYDRAAVPGSVLEVERENFDQAGARRQLWCYAISAKRYALYIMSDYRPVLVKCSEHGLGQYMNPVDPDAADRQWVAGLWAGIVGDAHGLTVDEQPWLDRPALCRLGVSTPTLLRPFPRGKTWRASVKPYNFALYAVARSEGLPEGVDPRRFRLIAPYEPDARRWWLLRWRNLYDRQPGLSNGAAGPIDSRGLSTYRLPTSRRDGRQRETAEWTGGTGEVPVWTYREVLARYRAHPERKSAGLDGRPGGAGTTGHLSRRTVRAGRALVIGKEAHRLDDTASQVGGLAALTVWGEGATASAALWARHWPVLAAFLRTLPREAVRARAGLSARALRDALAGRAVPRGPARTRLAALVAEVAGLRLGAVDVGEVSPEARALSGVGARRGRMTTPAEPRCEQCGASLAGRRATAHYCSDRCRKAAGKVRRAHRKPRPGVHGQPGAV